MANAKIISFVAARIAEADARNRVDTLTALKATLKAHEELTKVMMTPLQMRIDELEARLDRLEKERGVSVPQASDAS